MKFASFKINESETYGVVEQGLLIDLVGLMKDIKCDLSFPNELLQGIEEGEEFIDRVLQILRKAGEKVKEHSYEESMITWLSPVPNVKRNIICVGKNYRDHAIEMGSEKEIPKDIMIFTKATNTVVGHQQTVFHHEELTQELDYEGELAVVIGKKGKCIPPEKALDFIFGYTIVNDITARDLQKKHSQFFIGKSLDTTCPMGPVVVTKDEIDDPHSLNITTRINTEIRQQSNTREMIFTIPYIISTLSKGMTLEAGDIIATGTPAGVGKGFSPPRFLKKGDIVEVSIESVGVLTNQLQA
ncbi:fumarylacetoacetate hydrolase family protein [Rossellomorea aquimaris]|uniref:fumarylacetoacetate hydrolase family protein n=1 Tax=Rossellomorea aquimaris TaxID=189382 RepID=UPI0007D0AD8B|nr:fumarylacetoacetate hydrolase family protein [Rossellomorea aquimaris]